MKITRHAVSYPIGVMVVVALSVMPAATLWANTMEEVAPSPPPIATVQSTYGKLPLSFEANQGQWDSSVQFVTRGRGHTLFLTPREAVLTARTGGAKDGEKGITAAQHKPLSSPSPSSQSVVRMKFAGADPQAEMVGLDKLPGIVNYFIGDDPSKWRTHIPTYQKVGYKDLYSGIDLVYYGNQGQLEYDLIVAPGADPNQIMLAFDGAEQLTVDEQGDLILTLPQSSIETTEGAAPTLRLHKPVVYQKDEQGEKHLLAGTYVLKPATAHPTVALQRAETPHVAFQVASYDATRPLIIDPVLSWATYLGGSGFDQGYGIAVDAAGNAYVTGLTGSSDFPGTAGSPIQSTHGGDHDVFVTKLNAAGTALAYSTYLGSNGVDAGDAIAVDAAGNAYVTGNTNSSNFPGTAGSAIQSTFGGRRDAFVTKLNAAGTSLLYSTYLGGSGNDVGRGIAVDQAGNAYVVGFTGSPSFPGTAGSAIQSTLGGGEDAFVTKLNAAGTALVYSTYLGDRSLDAGSGIALDATGNAYVTGNTSSDNFPGTADSPIQSTHSGGFDAFVTKLNAAGTSLLYSTYLGGSGDDAGFGIAVDAASNVYVTGNTTAGSNNFPGMAGSLIQSTFGGGLFDGFVAKLNAAGTALAYATYLGGNGTDQGLGIAVDAAGNAYVTGSTESSNFPGTAGSAIQGTLGGGEDAFVTKLNAEGTSIVYSTYLGGSGTFDVGNEIAVNAAGNAYVTGYTESSNFPGTAGSAIQNTLGLGDAFVAKIISSIPFAAFDAKAKIDVDDRQHHGGASHHRPHHDNAEGRYYQHQDKDEFDLTATFTLGAGSNGIAPLTEPVIIQVGTFSTAIPACSFKQHKGRFVFEGTINGVHLQAVLRSLILGNDYELKVEGHGADLTGTKNPVTVSVTIGDDSGSKAITAKIK